MSSGENELPVLFPDSDPCVSGSRERCSSSLTGHGYIVVELVWCV